MVIEELKPYFTAMKKFHGAADDQERRNMLEGSLHTLLTRSPSEAVRQRIIALRERYNLSSVA